LEEAGSLETVRRPDPEVSVAVAEQREDLDLLKRLRDSSGGEGRTVPQGEAVVGADPETPVADGDDGVDLLVGQRAGSWYEVGAVQPEDASIAGSDPDAAVGCFGDGDGERGGRIGGNQLMELSLAIAEFALKQRRDQQFTVASAIHGDNAFGASGEEAVDVSVAVAKQELAFLADPQRALIVGLKAEDMNGSGKRGIDAMTVDEGLAVEAQESAVGSDPEITIGGLGDAVDLAAGKAVACPPEGSEVLLQRAIGIERAGYVGDDAEQEKQDCQSHGHTICRRASRARWYEVRADTRTSQRRPRPRAGEAPWSSGSRTGACEHARRRVWEHRR
jgi:hypothetical protein